jgi:hypothetical protein
VLKNPALCLEPDTLGQRVKPGGGRAQQWAIEDANRPVGDLFCDKEISGQYGCDAVRLGRLAARRNGQAVNHQKIAVAAYLRADHSGKWCRHRHERREAIENLPASMPKVGMRHTLGVSNKVPRQQRANPEGADCDAISFSVSEHDGHF